MKQIQHIDLDINPRGFPPPLFASQYDEVARAFSATIYDDTGILDLSGISRVEIFGTKSDGTGFSRNDIVTIDREHALITWDCIPQMTASPGDLVCGMALYDANNHRIGPANFLLKVQESALPVERITKASDFGSLLQDAVNSYLDGHDITGEVETNNTIWAAPGKFFGDLTGDGDVTNADIIYAADYLNGGYSALPSSIFNSNGGITEAEVKAILNITGTPSGSDVNSLIYLYDGEHTRLAYLYSMPHTADQKIERRAINGGERYEWAWVDAERGPAGERGIDGSKWYSGALITGTSTTPQTYQSAGIHNANVGDLYLCTSLGDSNGNVYQCTTAGNPSTAQWVYKGNIRGADGSPGSPGSPGSAGAAGSKWHAGDRITGTNTSQIAYTGSGIANANVGDMYLCTADSESRGNVYQCVIGGNASNAYWVYKGNIRGPAGSGGGGSGTAGEDGGYYIPSVDANGVLSMTASKSGMPTVPDANIKGPAGTDGADGSQWYAGALITGTSTTPQTYQSAGIHNANVGDMYLCTSLGESNGNVYQCTTAGNPSTARWVHKGNIRGTDGSAGSAGADGSKWHAGDRITGTSTSPLAFPNSGIANANVSDMYLCTADGTSQGNVYQCTTAGNAANAYWVYKGSIRGPAGSGGSGSGTAGEDGGYYIPSVNANGVLSMTASKSGMPTVPDANIKGPAGADGSQWYSGALITGTSTTPQAYQSAGIPYANVGDMYLCTSLGDSNGNVYQCTTAGNPSTAQWVYKGNIKGTAGAAGSPGANGTDGADGSKWYAGSGVTGTSTTAQVFSSSGVTSAKIGDMYLCTASGSSNGNTYQCTVAGAPSAAKWVYKGNIRGAAGEDGGYYVPSIDASGVLSMTASKSGMPTIPNANIKGPAGADGADGSQWLAGGLITGTSTTPQTFQSAGIQHANVGDLYLHTASGDSNGNVYQCTTAGNPSNAQWVYKGNIKGTAGAAGSAGANGSQWYAGSGVTGTSTTAQIFSGSGVTDARVGDMYLCTASGSSNGNTYQCTVAGAPSTAKWAYKGSIKGPQGATGATPNLTIGTVTTLAAGQSATASIGGTTANPTLNLGIPRGPAGQNATAKQIKSIEVITRTAAGHLFGDISGDGNFNSLDLQILELYLDGDDIGDVDMEAADVNFDGEFDENDFATLAYEFVHNGTTFGTQYIFAKHIITYQDNSTQVILSKVPITYDKGLVQAMIAGYVDSLDGSEVLY